MCINTKKWNIIEKHTISTKKQNLNIILLEWKKYLLEHMQNLIFLFLL